MGCRRVKLALQNFLPSLKNVLDIAKFKKFGPLSENSLPPLVPQADHEPVGNYDFLS